VGGGDLRSELEKEALKLGLRVVFTGTQEDIRPYIGIFDVAVLSSHTEGLGIFLLEAMAMNIPVVATQVGGIPEVVVSGETGYLVPPNDPQTLARYIMKILNDTPKLRKMGQAGRQRAEKIFSLKQTLSNTIDLYRKILDPIHS
jgi:glycosyltransferase involved in cell wall biosynthesis